MPQRGERLVEACSCCCRIGMVERVLLMNFVIKCDIWTVALSRARLNGVRSIFTSLPCELVSNHPSIEVAGACKFLRLLPGRY